MFDLTKNQSNKIFTQMLKSYENRQEAYKINVPLSVETCYKFMIKYGENMVTICGFNSLTFPCMYEKQVGVLFLANLPIKTDESKNLSNKKMSEKLIDYTNVFEKLFVTIDFLSAERESEAFGYIQIVKIFDDEILGKMKNFFELKKSKGEN